MNDSDNTPEVNDLDDFENDFYGREEDVEINNEDEDIDEVDDEDVDDLAPEDNDEDDEDEPEVDQPKGKKNRNSFQERINELTAKAREAERRETALMKRLEELEAGNQREEKKPEPKNIREQLPSDAPHPDDTDDDGNALYELGEYDPKYITALSRFTVQAEMKAAQEEANQRAEADARQKANEELAEVWLGKLDKAEETIPTIREDIVELTEVFQNLPTDYGDYLAATIMQSEVGPEIMHYFSQNIGEAQKIVAAGPAAATIALGRLEAKFIRSSEQEETKGNRQRVSDAPPPPETRTRGTGGKFATRPDTDDQDAFERAFFNKK